MNSETNRSCQQQLEQLQREFDEFAYIVSHDLKAPLRAICNLSGWISEDLGEDLDPGTKHNIALLQNRAERMERMITALLQYSRIGRHDMEVRQVDVAALVDKVASPFIEANNLELHTSPLPNLTTYQAKLETVFAHLLQNAVQHNQQEKPEVWITATEQNDFILFSVKDNGTGISEDARDKIFKMFFTAQPKDKHESLGTGLTIAKKIVQYVGGTINVESTLGKGTAITFSWPRSTP
ncbi:MAG: sensor histidine kinase [Rufibacter sp.]